MEYYYARKSAEQSKVSLIWYYVFDLIDFEDQWWFYERAKTVLNDVQATV